MLLLFVLLALIPALALAAAFGSEFQQVTGWGWGAAFVLSTASGLLALLNRARDELRASGELRWPLIFLGSHILGGWLAGALVFIYGIGAGWNSSTILGAIILASFGGSVVIEKLALKWLSKQLGVDVTKPMPIDEERRRPIDRRVKPPIPRAQPRPLPPHQLATSGHASDYAPLDE